MKRIVDGLTYNTDTSTLLARAEWTLDDTWSPYNGAECEGNLYQTRGGAFFLVTTIHISGNDDVAESTVKVEFGPMSPERAEAWLLEGDVEVFHNPFDEPPEATAEAVQGATLYLRLPVSLKQRVEAAATEARLSANAWAMKCIEKCLGAD